MTETTTQPSVRTTVLGEELPIFCEKCGYQLVGLPQNICTQCEIRQFICPECGHHQPINTLRPAFQKTLGRIRAGWLTFVVLFKLNYFGWTLFVWGVFGASMIYSYRYRYSNYGSAQMMTYDMILGSVFFGAVWGFIGRILLLRWANGAMVGLVLGGLLCLAMIFGAYFAKMDMYNYQAITPEEMFHHDFVAFGLFAAGAAVLGASVAWTIWHLLIRAFLPRKTAQSLIEWQRNMSVKEVAALSKAD